ERGVGPVEHLVPLLGPVERLGLLGPEPLEVGVRALEDPLVGDVRALDELLRRLEGLLLEHLLERLLKGLLGGHRRVSSSPVPAAPCGGDGSLSNLSYVRCSGLTGITVRPNVEFVTAAKDAYHAASAVASPT